MAEYELICVDMFQTLVDVNTRIPYIWSRILKDSYTKELENQCVSLVRTRAFSKYHENTSRTGEFVSIKSIFEPYFYEIQKETGLDFDPREALEIFLEEHRYSEQYEDVKDFFGIIGDEIPICLISDADVSMVESLVDRFKFNGVFISETSRSYKNDPEGKIFKQVIEHYNIDPSKIIHIGDSPADILGAHRAGISSCWINRHNTNWNHSIKPQYTINSLREIEEIVKLVRV
jgi:HAD superfamily hydrolase (TIGR01549 family)